MPSIEETEIFRDVFQYMARETFRAEVSRFGAVSALRDLRVHGSARPSADTEFRVLLESGFERRFDPSRFHFLDRYEFPAQRYFLQELGDVLCNARLRNDAVRRAIERIFYIEREEVLFELEARHARAALDEAERSCAPLSVLMQLRSQYERCVYELREHRDRAQDRTLPTTAWRSGPATTTRHALRAQEIVPLWDRTAFVERMPDSRELFRELCLGNWGFDLAGPEDQEARERAHQRREEAAARGLKLLKDHLTPAQLKDYEQRRYFHVTGGTTGKTYRILHGRQINIRELGADGKVVAKLCFLPGGDLVEGDVMLAQKFALELQEQECLKVANRYPVVDGIMGATADLLFVDEAATIPEEVFRRTVFYGVGAVMINPTGPIINTDATS